MPDITVVSWNIQKLGAAKLENLALRDFIARVAIDAQAHVLMVMEVVGGQQNTIVNPLCETLNRLSTQLPGHWFGQISDQQAGAPFEQYAIFWREAQAVPVTQPGDFRLTGFIGEALLTNIGVDYDADTDHALLDCLNRNGIVEMQGGFLPRVRDEALPTLQDPTTFRNLAGLQAALPDADHETLDNLRLVLLESHGPGFPRAESRSPFAGRLTLFGTQLQAAVFHAPNPGNPWKYPAIMALARIPVPAGARELELIAGDYNLRTNDWARQCWRTPADGPREEFASPLGPLEALGYARALDPNQPESRSSLSLPTQDGQADGPDAYRSNPYDNAVVRAGDAVEAVTGVEILDLVARIRDDAGYRALAEEIYGAWVEAHRKRRRRGADPPDFDVATALWQAWQMYRTAISDHLPLRITLQCQHVGGAP